MKERARKAGLLAVFVFATALTTVCSVQILLEVFGAPKASTSLGCRDGIRALDLATDRARAQAAAKPGGEREAIVAFRQAIEPEWSASRAIEVRCQADKDLAGTRALRAVSVRRYAEERAVRYEAVDLSSARRRAPELVRGLFVDEAPPSGPHLPTAPTGAVPSDSESTTE